MIKRYIVLWFVFIAAVGLSGCNSFGFGEDTDYSIAGLQEMQETQDYVQAVLDDRLEQELLAEEGTEDYIRAENYREEMIEADLLKAMKARGYYDAEVIFQDNETQDLSGIYQIDPGIQYKISEIRVEPQNFEEELDFPLIEEGKPLIASNVLQAQSKLYEQVQKDRCSFYMDVGHRVRLNQENHTAIIIFDVEVGQDAVFGGTTFGGQETIDVDYLEKLIPWVEGDCFRREKLETLTTRLLETGLFSRADTTLPESPAEDGSVPITVSLKEREHRTIKVGANYYTDTGAGILFGWEHRNLFGSAEKLEAELKLNQIEQNLNFDFIKPYFLRDDQQLNINASLGLEDTDAYEATNFETGASISRDFTDHLSGNTGVAYALSEIDDGEDTETYGLFSLPNGFTYDNRSNPLDPHDGIFLTGSIEPFFDTLGQSDPFTKIQAGARTYFELSNKQNIVLAMRGNVAKRHVPEACCLLVERFVTLG